MVARCRARDGVSSHQWLPVAAQWLHRMTGVGILHNISGPQLCNAPTQSNILNIYCAGDGLNQLTVGAVHATGRKIISPGAEVGSISGGILEQRNTRTVEYSNKAAADQSEAEQISGSTHTTLWEALIE